MKRSVSVLLVWLSLVMATGAPASATPADWSKESIYFIMIDRFRDGDPNNNQGVNKGDIRSWHGGDLQGIIEKLDYIKGLGFTAIWLTPHVKNTGLDYHGYGAVDYFDVDPHFGDTNKVKELVDAAHKKGLKVLFDMVVNHTGPKSPLVTEHPDWFHPRCDISNWNDTNQVQNCWIFGLPDFDQSKPEVRDYILSYSRFWIEQTGVDGFRLDTVRHVPADFFTWYSAELQKVKPGFWLIGEVWETGPARLAAYQKAGVTALMDFPMDDAARKVFAKDSSFSQLTGVNKQVEAAMPDPTAMGGFLDNHDMSRFISEAKDDKVNRLKLGLTWLFSSREIPILYYGTEIGMVGTNDPYNRVDFPWDNQTNPDVQQLVTKLNQIRVASPALQKGQTVDLLVEAKAYAYARRMGTDLAIVALNNQEAPFASAVPVAELGLKEGTTLVDQVSGAKVKVQNGAFIPGLTGRAGAIYTVQPSSVSTWGLGALVVAALAAVGGLLFVRRRRVR
jgi:alpha-amylase